MNDVQGQAFEAWYRDAISDGAAWFNMNLRTPIGIKPYVCRFIDIYEGPVLIGGKYWQYNATLELWERPLAPHGWGNFPEFIAGQNIIDLAINTGGRNHDSNQYVVRIIREQAINETLQIVVGAETFWITDGYEDITAIIEDGSTQTFIASAINIAIPARNADGTQDLKWAIGNIDGSISNAIQKVLDEGEIGVITYRKYISDDLSYPAERPFTLTVKSGTWSAIEAQITAGYMNVLDTAWPRRRYTLPLYPGLRYI